VKGINNVKIMKEFKGGNQKEEEEEQPVN